MNSKEGSISFLLVSIVLLGCPMGVCSFVLRVACAKRIVQCTGPQIKLSCRPLLDKEPNQVRTTAKYTKSGNCLNLDMLHVLSFMPQMNSTWTFWLFGSAFRPPCQLRFPNMRARCCWGTWCHSSRDPLCAGFHRHRQLGRDLGAEPMVGDH